MGANPRSNLGAEMACIGLDTPKNVLRNSVKKYILRGRESTLYSLASLVCAYLATDHTGFYDSG